ncbi:flavodoxin [uncultured Eubacterium sp.]|uniref:flavodoxin n=1 Tax=uncultured Eubacterium sp. TaxID=165185 RepID=UPI0026280FD1|nr:flavodoxin [uncultured Eubacterium sp.]
MMQKSTKGRLYKINPSKPYTKEDINYSVNKCRANVEQQSETARPEIKGKVKKIRKSGDEKQHKSLKSKNFRLEKNNINVTIICL